VEGNGREDCGQAGWWNWSVPTDNSTHTPYRKERGVFHNRSNGGKTYSSPSIENVTTKEIKEKKGRYRAPTVIVGSEEAKGGVGGVDREYKQAKSTADKAVAIVKKPRERLDPNN